MACLNSDGSRFESMDLEAQGSKPLVGQNKKRACLSLPVLLGALGLLFGTVALIVAGVFASRSSQTSSPGLNNAVVFVRDPRHVPEGFVLGPSLTQGTGYYARLQPMVYSRSDHKTIPVGDSIYILGGLTNAAAVKEANSSNIPVVLNKTVSYDSYAETMVEMADMLSPRYRFAAAPLDGKVYVIGGMPIFEGPTAERHLPSTSVDVYDPTTNKWSKATPNKTPRSDACAAAVGGKLYLVGGWTTDYSDTLGSVEVYDPKSNSWSLLATNMSIPRGDCECAAVDDRYLYVIGGVDNNGFTNAVEAYDVQEGSWAKKAGMITPRGDFAAEALPGGRIIVMGGETNNGTMDHTEFALHKVEEYVADIDVWIAKAPLPEARFRFDTAHVRDSVFVFGGQPTCSSANSTDKPVCVSVGLNTTWGYFDIPGPALFSIAKA